MMRPLRTLIRNRSGAAALETAIILPIVAGILMATLDFSNGWLTKLRLEQAAQRGIELVAMRKGVATSYDYARDEMISAWGGAYTSATVQSWLECGGTLQQSATADCAGAQRSRYVKLRIAATFNPMFNWGILYDGPASDGNATLVGDAVVRVQ